MNPAPEEIGYGYVIERYVTKKDSGRPRYRDLKSGRVLRPGWPHAELVARHLIDDAVTITDAELEALLGYEWRSRLTAAWLIGVGRRATFRDRIGDLLLASEFCFSGGGYCFALARFGTHADAEILTTVLGELRIGCPHLWTGPRPRRPSLPLRRTQLCPAHAPTPTPSPDAMLAFTTHNRAVKANIA
ncbi:DUF6000 family protein [Streptomyces antnestii]|uniref:DUF6000 family protein n=1 Tax=Streptomyces antnestii TaxID=2494256 RepID=UPI001CB8E460|nr:DUF6000 family protein [Streptomyces sp. San01]